MLKNIRIKNFRCFKDDVVINFEDGMTLVIGENDAGKTTLVDALKVVFQGQKVEPYDFYYGTTEVVIEVEVDDITYISKHNLENCTINSDEYIKLSHEKISDYNALIDEDDFVENNDNFEKAKKLADCLGVVYRSTTHFDTLVTHLSEKINELLTEKDPVIFKSKIPELDIIFLVLLLPIFYHELTLFSA